MDGSRIRPDRLGTLAWNELRVARIAVGRFERRLDEVFEIEPLASPDPTPTIAIEGSPRLLRLGEGMEAGLLLVNGDAGRVAGLLGGEVLISGNAGPDVGLGQRRGLIVICGQAGGAVGRHMRAGTIVIARGTLEHPGLGMRRGSILALGDKPRMAPGFERDGLVWPSWTRLLSRRLGAMSFPATAELEAQLASHRPLEAWSGDRLSLGRGEVLFPA